jgi:hypothetical protein
MGAAEEGGGEAIRIDISAGSMYLAIVPCRNPMDKQASMRPFRDPVYSSPRGAAAACRRSSSHHA